MGQIIVYKERQSLNLEEVRVDGWIDKTQILLKWDTT